MSFGHRFTHGAAILDHGRPRAAVSRSSARLDESPDPSPSGRVATLHHYVTDLSVKSSNRGCCSELLAFKPPPASAASVAAAAPAPIQLASNDIAHALHRQQIDPHPERLAPMPLRPRRGFVVATHYYVTLNTRFGHAQVLQSVLRMNPACAIRSFRRVTNAQQLRLRALVVSPQSTSFQRLPSSLGRASSRGRPASFLDIFYASHDTL